MARLSNGYAARVLAHWRALLELPRSILLPIAAIGIVALATVSFNEWSVSEINRGEVELTALLKLQQELSRQRVRLSDLAVGGLQSTQTPQTLTSFRHELATASTRLSNRALELHRHAAYHVAGSRLAVIALASLTLVLLFITIQLILKDAKQQAIARDEQLTLKHDLKHLVAKRNAELFALTTHIQTAAEQEKAEVARNLHDELGGLLTAAKMDLAWLQQHATERDDAVQAKLTDLQVAIDEAMNLKRRVVEGLRPALLDHFGLSIALRAHFEETCAKAGLDCQLDLPDNGEPVPPGIATALFRVAQESLTNVMRHAKATSVAVSFAVRDGAYWLQIADDGVGIDLAALDSTAYHGLVGMRHRVHALRGTFKISANYPRGSKVNVVIPIGAPARESADKAP